MAQKRPPVHCRVCKEKIYRDEEDGWIMPSRNYYYHEKCYSEWAVKKDDIRAQASNDEWYEALKYYLSNVIKAPIDYKKTKSQWNNYLKQKKTAKGVYFAIRYFYDVLRGDKSKCLGGIGIVSSVYDDSCAYWYHREENDSGVCERIEEQMRVQAQQKQITVKQTKKKTIRNKAISLEEINEMEG